MVRCFILLSFGCLVAVNVQLLFLTVPWVGLQFAIVAFPDHTHLLLNFSCNTYAHDMYRPVLTSLGYVVNTYIVERTSVLE